jgi:predicted DNA-binding transcriptional regulator AlpA
MEKRDYYEVLRSIERLLRTQKTTFNVDDLRSYTGLSKSAVYKLTQRRLIPYSKPNSKVIFFKKEDVDAYLLSNRIETQEEIEKIATNYIIRNKWAG